MDTIVRLYSTNLNELNNFLNDFFSSDISLNNQSNWEKHYSNPVELADIIAALLIIKNFILVLICGLVLIMAFL